MKITPRRLRPWLLILAVVALALPAAASAAVSSWSGKGDNDATVKVTFNKHGGPNPYVNNFQISNMLYKPRTTCGFRSGVNLGTIRMSINANGKFSFHGDANQNGIHYHADVTGKFETKRRATGHVTETRTSSSGTCTASEDWTAHKQ